VLLSAISFHRTGYGLLLVIAFSVGLAGVLTGVGLLFIHAGRLLVAPLSQSRFAAVVKFLPVASALVITAAGVVISYQALTSTGMSSVLTALRGIAGAFPLQALSMLGFGFVLGMKHSLDADHLAAVSTIAVEGRGTIQTSMIGAVWGMGHTVSLLAAGAIVVVLGVHIGDETARWLELAVAAMLVGLGVDAVRKLGAGAKVHTHEHGHGVGHHAHPHFHEVVETESPDSSERDHHSLGPALRVAMRLGRQTGRRPFIVGMVHGLAGSSALLLLVLATTRSTALSMAIIGVFGIGSIAGMSLASILIGVPFRLAAHSSYRVSGWVRAAAGVFSICFGMWMMVGG
jgi:ABC-type nickel/cobalt efflux system permease component RcnA